MLRTNLNMDNEMSKSHTLDGISNQQNIENKKVPEESMKNPIENSKDNRNMEEEYTSQIEEQVLGINFCIEISCNNDPDQQDIIVTSHDKVIKLLNKWLIAGESEGVYGKEH